MDFNRLRLMKNVLTQNYKNMSEISEFRVKEPLKKSFEIEGVSE